MEAYAVICTLSRLRQDHRCKGNLDYMARHCLKNLHPTDESNGSCCKALVERCRAGVATWGNHLPLGRRT